MSIFIQHFNIKIGIRSLEVENIIFRIAKPIFPTNIPAFHQYLVEAMFGGKINILLYISIVSRMNPVGFHPGIIRFIEFHRRNIPSIRPWLSTGNHFPPHTDVLHRLNPRSIFIFTRLIQVKNKIRCQYLPCVVTHHHRTPRSMARTLHICFVSYRIRSQP